MATKKFTVQNVKKREKKIEKIAKIKKPKIKQLLKKAFKNQKEETHKEKSLKRNILCNTGNMNGDILTVDLFTPTSFNFESVSNCSQSEQEIVNKIIIKEKEDLKVTEISELDFIDFFQPKSESVHTDLNFPFTSDVMDDEGMELIFHKKYQKVQKLDSPQMSLSSTQKVNILPLFRFQDDHKFGFEPFRQDNSEMFSKMQLFCRDSVVKKSFRLLPTFRKEVGHDFGIKQETKNKSSSRKSKKTSRKNSNNENFNLI